MSLFGATIVSPVKPSQLLNNFTFFLIWPFSFALNTQKPKILQESIVYPPINAPKQWNTSTNIPLIKIPAREQSKMNTNPNPLLLLI